MKTPYLILSLVIFLAGCISAPKIQENQNLRVTTDKQTMVVSENLEFFQSYNPKFGTGRTWMVPAGTYRAVLENELGTYFQTEEGTVRFRELGITETFPGGIYVRKNGATFVYIYPKKSVPMTGAVGYMLSPHDSLPFPCYAIPAELATKITLVK